MTGGNRKLTSLENEALQAELNVSDGHPRMALTSTQRALIDGLAEMFDEARARPFSEIENQAHRAYFSGLGQNSAPVGTGRILSCYSSSTAMDLVARMLAGRTQRVALIHPTFDNLPDLFRARGLSLFPLAEQDIAAGLEELPEDVGAVFVTSPNNPTGWVMPEAALRRLARWCRETGRVLGLDTCFRGQDTRAQYDTYLVLADSGVEWVVIEDTGKLWPVLELKAGFLSFAECFTSPLLDAFDDLLLSISPLVLLVIRELADDASAGGYAEMHRLLSDNRKLLSDAVAAEGLRLTDPDSRISVARLTVPDSWGTATELYGALVKRGVHTLPCDAFYWADPAAGRQQLRIALARDSGDVARAGLALREVSTMYRAAARGHR